MIEDRKQYFVQSLARATEIVEVLVQHADRVALQECDDPLEPCAQNQLIATPSSNTVESSDRLASPAANILLERATMTPAVLPVGKCCVSSQKNGTISLFGHPALSGASLFGYESGTPRTHGESYVLQDGERVPRRSTFLNQGTPNNMQATGSLQLSEQSPSYAVDALFDSLRTELLSEAPGNNRPPDFCIWPSIIISEPTLGDETATWSPQLSGTAFNSARLQILPYFASEHWQLAVFDIVEYVIFRYDPWWPLGTDHFIFSVSYSAFPVQTSLN